jgi:adenylate cyclase
MPIIHYLSDQVRVEVKDKSSILAASLQAKIPHAHVCGGYARCTTCRVVVVEGLRNCLPRNADEQRLADRLRFSPDIRLACQTQITGDVTVRRLVLDDKDILLTNQIRQGAVPGSVGQQQNVGILFAGLRGFSTFADNNLAYDALHILNRYIYEMSQVVYSNGGDVVRILSDGIIAVFAIENTQQTALRTVKAGLEMVKSMDQLSTYIHSVHRAKLAINIGVHYGPAVVGMIGPDSKQGHIAIGHAVNLVSSIGAVNEPFGTRLLVSGEVYHRVRREVQLGQQGAFTLPEFNSKQTLYEIIGINKTVVVDPVKAPTSIGPQPPAQRQQSRDMIMSLGTFLLGLFLAGFFSNLANTMLILVFTALGLMGAILFVWGLLK